jgi:hypothetical protein
MPKRVVTTVLHISLHFTRPANNNNRLVLAGQQHTIALCALLGLKEEIIHINMTMGIRLTILSPLFTSLDPFLLTNKVL